MELTDNLKSFDYDGKRYLLLESIRETLLNENYFVGCKSSRKCIEKRCIPESVCLYVRNGKIYTKTYKAADVYVERHYAIANILDETVFEKKQQALSNEKKQLVKEKRIAKKQYVEHELAPPVVHLEDHEMFKDTEGNPMEIEVCGAKQWDKAYFKAYDVGKAFAYERINDAIIEKTSNNVYKQHYVYFKSPKNNAVDTNNALYLTYLGVIKILMCSRGDKAERFHKWVAGTLFAVQMGETDARDKVAADALRVGVSTITEVFRKSARSVPCVYLFEIGKVGELRKYNQCNPLDLSGFTDDNAVLYKYGMTSDMARRSKEHAATYGKWKGGDFKLTVFSYIDAVYVSDAETTLKHTFDSMGTRVNDRQELIVATSTQLAFIREAYTNIYCRYAGNNADLIRQVQDLQHEKELMKRDMIATKMGMEIKVKDCELMYLRKMMEIR